MTNLKFIVEFAAQDHDAETVGNDFTACVHALGSRYDIITYSVSEVV